MGREQMRNLEVFKIGGTQVNEFEYQKKHGELTEQLDHHPDESAGASRRPTQAERVKQLMAEAHKKVEKKRKREAAKAGRSKKVAASNKPTAQTTRGAAKKASKSSRPAGKKTPSAAQRSSSRGAKKASKK